MTLGNKLLQLSKAISLQCTTNYIHDSNQGRIQDFKLGGVHLKKLRRAEGGVKFFWVFRVKNRNFTSKNHIYFNLGGGRTSGAPPSPRGSTPGNNTMKHFS